MIIRLENVIPGFLEKEKISRSQVWGNILEINAGEKMQIVAPSGSGKTSLVHFLYGLRNDYSGKISIQEKDIRSFSSIDLAYSRSNSISIIFQDLRLFPGHTVFENINIKRSLQRYHTVEKIKEMAARLGIENKLNKMVGNCSYGEQQRVAIIRALQQPFDVLLMDEPFSNLDEANRQVAMQLIAEEAADRKAAIILADLKKIDFFNAGRLINL